MASPGSTIRVLVLDDEPALLRSTSRMLSRAGYEVHEASTATQAQSIVDFIEGPVHVLLCDLQLEGLHGPDAASVLHASRPEMRVVFMSGGDAHDVEGHLGSSSPVFLSKPFGTTELLAAIERVME